MIIKKYVALAEEFTELPAPPSRPLGYGRHSLLKAWLDLAAMTSEFQYPCTWQERVEERQAHRGSTTTCGGHVITLQLPSISLCRPVPATTSLGCFCCKGGSILTLQSGGFI